MVASRPCGSPWPLDPASLLHLVNLIKSTKPELYSVGGDVFQYRFGVVDEDPSASCWVYVFYHSLPFITLTVPPGEVA